MKLSRFLKSLWPWRWWTCLHALAGGVRVHPSVCLFGSTAHIRLARGTSIGARSRLDAGRDGQIALGEGVWASSDVEIETNSEVQIGEGTTIQRRCTINGSTRIGAGCIFAPNVFVSSGTHHFRETPHLPIREQERKLAASNAGFAALDRPVWIQDDCWLGTNVVVCPGVTIGKGSVVGANAVVTRDVSPYSVVGGVPAGVIGRRLEWVPGRSVAAENDIDQPYVLSGRLLNGGKDRPASIEASLDTPLCFALTAAGANSELVLQWQAPAPVQFKIGGRKYGLPAGCGSLDLPIDIPTIDGEVFRCSVQILGPNSHAVLWVSHIALKTIN